MGILVRGLGVDHVCWGTDAVWTGSPQWQIEGLRRLEIPEAMQKQHGFTPLGDATGPVKTAIFGGNNARLYNIDPQRADGRDRARSARRAEDAYEKNGPERSNLRYGYVAPGSIDHAGVLRVAQGRCSPVAAAARPRRSPGERCHCSAIIR